MKTLLVGIALLGLTAQAQATAQLWLDGNRPYETVPYREMDTEVYSGLAPGASAGGLRLEYGLSDWAMVLGSGAYQSGTSSWIASAGGRVKFFSAGTLPLDLALFYDANFSQAPLNQRLGVVLAREIGEHSFAVNLGSDDFKGFLTSAGYKTPFLYWTLQLGLEGSYYAADGSWTCTPQLISQLPGDIAFEVGARVKGKGEAPTWLLSLSYEIFPTP